MSYATCVAESLYAIRGGMENAFSFMNVFVAFSGFTVLASYLFSYRNLVGSGFGTDVVLFGIAMRLVLDSFYIWKVVSLRVQGFAFLRMVGLPGVEVPSSELYGGTVAIFWFTALATVVDWWRYDTVAAFVFRGAALVFACQLSGALTEGLRVMKSQRSAFFRGRSRGFGSGASLVRSDGGRVVDAGGGFGLGSTASSLHWRTVECMVGGVLPLASFDGLKVSIVFSRDRTKEQDVLYRGWKMKGDLLWDFFVVFRLGGERAAGDMSLLRQSVCSSAAYGRWLRPRLAAAGVDAGDYSDHTLMDKFEALIFVFFDGVDTLEDGFSSLVPLGQAML